MNNKNLLLSTCNPPSIRHGFPAFLAIQGRFSPAIRMMLLVLCGGMGLVLSGCQQPAAHSGGGRPALFDFTQKPQWFGGKSLFARSQQTADAGRYQSQIPDIQINDGGAFGFGGNGNGQLANNDPASGRGPGANNNGQVQNLNQQIGAFDADNQLLNTEVASLQQKLQLANQYNQQLKEQLAGTTTQVRQVFADRETATRQVSDLRVQLDQATENLRRAQQTAQSAASTPSQMAGYSGGGAPHAPTQLPSTRGTREATLRANNSLLQKLSAIQIPGGQARMDGDVIRIEFPSDRMFVPGSYQIQPAQLPLLQNIVRTVAQSFPRQILGVEAHWDNTPLNPPGTTDHQLTATQSLAVFEQLVQLGLPKNQLFTMAMASNRPRHQPGTAGGINPNRRIELVIYPETYDGS